MTLDQRIKAACDATEPFTKARKKALAEVRWVLRDQFGHYVAKTVRLADGVQMTADASKTVVFDGRDNEVMKVNFFQAVTGLDLEIVLVN